MVESKKNQGVKGKKNIKQHSKMNQLSQQICRPANEELHEDGRLVDDDPGEGKELGRMSIEALKYQHRRPHAKNTLAHVHWADK